MTVDRIVEQDKTLEKLRVQEDINEIGLLVGRNPKMIALIVFKNKVTLQNKTQDGCSTESCIKAHYSQHTGISEAQMSTICML